MNGVEGDCPQGGDHDWGQELTRGGQIITVCAKCGARR